MERARRIGQVACNNSEEITWHHGQLIDYHPAVVLVPGEEHINVSVVQGSLTASTEITASLQGVASHCMSDSVLEGDTEEVVFMASLDCFREKAVDPCDHSACAGPWLFGHRDAIGPSICKDPERNLAA